MKNDANIISLEDLEKMLAFLLDSESGRNYLKKNFEGIKKLFFAKAENTKGTFQFIDVNEIQFQSFFRFIDKLEGIPELKDEYEDYSFWSDLYKEIEIPGYEAFDAMRILSMKDGPEKQQLLSKMISTNDGNMMKNSVFYRILISENKDEREEKAIVLKHIAQGEGYTFKGCGVSSLVIQTGSQIAKLSLGKRKFEVPYHPRIMMPYYRKKYSDNSCLEVFNYGNAESADITDEKLLEIYLELLRDKIRWGDASKRNLVVLTSDNVLPDFIASEEFNVFGFLEDERYPTNNHKALKAGDIVICDLDLLFAIDDPDYRLGYVDDVIASYLLQNNDKKDFVENFSEDGRED